MEGVIGHDKWGRKVTTSTPTRHERFNPRFCLSLLRNPGSDTWGSETDRPTGTNRMGGKWSSDSDRTTAPSKVGILVGCQVNLVARDVCIQINNLVFRERSITITSCL
ncbi:hypothetical protein CDAR_54781 [Caerostris darwini]|uniref:Uncharacterized protein n=1 Tax=Caerostris darwini TaxID=1538125 RepID=A0AAV4RZX1_9ARAC|nr:hypothetical protein CDAR_54781 [Caerostris darwini]